MSGFQDTGSIVYPNLSRVPPSPPGNQNPCEFWTCLLLFSCRRATQATIWECKFPLGPRQRIPCCQPKGRILGRSVRKYFICYHCRRSYKRLCFEIWWSDKLDQSWGARRNVFNPPVWLFCGGNLVTVVKHHQQGIENTNIPVNWRRVP